MDHFTDDNGQLFEDDINAISDAGITRGCNPPVNDHYCPDELLTRGQAAAFMRRALLPWARTASPIGIMVESRIVTLTRVPSTTPGN